MKRSVSTWLAVMLALTLILAACGQSAEPTAEPASADAETAEEPADESTEAEAAADTEEADEEPADEGADAEAAAEATEEPAEESTEEEADAETEAITDTAEMTDTADITATAPMTTAPAMTGTETTTDAVPVSLDLDVMQGRSALASTVIGYQIQNTGGDNIGAIEDIVVNLIDGRVLFVTMRYGGGLFQSAQVIPVPTSAFSVDAENEVLQLDVAEAALEDAPSFESGWPDFTAEGYDASEYDADVYAYWTEQFPDLPVPEQSDAADVAGAVAKVSDMLGLRVVNPQGQNIGEIQDMIVNVEQQLLSAAVLTFGGFRLIGSDSYVIPYAGFGLDVSGVDRNNPLGTPVLNLSQNNLANAPQFFPNNVDLSDPNWSEPYQSWWTRMAETGRGAESALPLAMTAWVLESFGEPEDNLQVITGTRPSVNFLLERYIGTGGCNWFLGIYTAGPDGLLRMQTPAVSMTAVCEPASVMEQEAAFMTTLRNVTEYQLEGENLIGYTVQNQRLLTLAPAQPVPFEGTTWALRFFLGGIQWIPLIPGTEVTAQFDGDQLSGSAGCNTYTATVARDEETLTIRDLTVTDETCTEPAGIMEQEARFLAVLESVATYVHVGGTVQMADSTEQPTLMFGIDITAAAQE